MNSMRKLICCLGAVVLAAFAAPGIAGPQKTYSLQLAASPTYDANNVVQVPVGVSVSVKNESPPSTANSNIGSFSFSLAGMAIVSQPSCPGAVCTLDTTTNTVSVTNISPPIQAQGIFAVSFGVSSCGDGSVANAAVFTGSQLNGATFKQLASASVLASNVSCGDLTCNASFTVPDSTGSAVSGIRGFDKDGVCFLDVPYYVTNTLPIIGGNLHFRWPVGTDPNADSAAAFKYTVTATASGNPQVAWLADTQGNPIFIAAPACLGDLPAPLGSLAADVSMNDKKITVTTTVATPTPPFPIVIGTERMQVTKIVSATGSWTVTRHTGGTSATTHSTGDDVMNTPLPLLTTTSGPYAAGNQAQMCLVGVSGNLTTFIDIGDGWSSP